MNRVIAAAIKRDGIIFTGVRHGHIIRDMVAVGFLTDKNKPVRAEEQGFIDSQGRFIGRFTARQVAFKAGQVDRIEGELYSEDVW